MTVGIISWGTSNRQSPGTDQQQIQMLTIINPKYKAQLKQSDSWHRP